MGDSDFVERALCGATEKMERRYQLETMGIHWVFQELRSERDL